MSHTNPLTRGKKQKAQTLLQQNHLEEAKALLEQVCDTDRRDVEAWYLLGAVNHGLRRIEEAVTCCRQVVALQPDNADAHYSLGSLFQEQKDMENALHHYQQALSIRPDFLEARSNLGRVFEAIGRLNEAAQSYEQALRLAPKQTELHYNLGNALQQLGRFEDAIEHFRQAIAIRPDYAEAHNNLGNTLTALDHVNEAVNCFHRAITLRSDYPEAHYNLGVALRNNGDLNGAIASYQRALEIKPDFTDALNNLAAVFTSQDHLDKAIGCYQRILALNPNDVGVIGHMAAAYTKMDRLNDAIAAYQRALEIEPSNTGALTNLGVTLMKAGRLDEAIVCLRQVLQYQPDSGPDAYAAHRALLVALLYHPSCSPEQLFDEHRRFETTHALPLYARQQEHTNAPDPKRRLRLGYLSSDFHVHPVAYSMIPLLESANRRHFEIFLYAEVKSSDRITEHLESLADHWRPTIGLNDEAVAEMIRQDGIDIFVCLAGRFNQNRPLVCAYKPAPVQVSYHDGTTSGLSAMDYFITDIIMNPKNTPERFTERLVRLPTFHLHPHLTFAPAISALPAQSSGYITFGSFNNPSKITPMVIALWSRVLKSIEGSRLLLKYMNSYADGDLRRRILEQFTQHDIGADRVLLEAQYNSRADHLAWYERVDIALDPFPFNGSTTTFEALWMGVPVIALLGQTMVSRWSGSMATRVGHPEFVAQTEEEYVECAKQLASDIPKLAALRSNLRDQVANSPVCDARARSRQLERAYRYMWRKWSASKTSSGGHAAA